MINATSFTGQLDCRFCYLTVRIQPKMLFGNLLLEVPESDLRSCEATQEVAKKAQKNF